MLWTDHVSYSQLKQAEQCPYSYYLTRLTDTPQTPNAFAQAGTLAHKLLHAWAVGDIKREDLPAEWQKEYPKAVTAQFPAYVKNYRETLLDKVGSYFLSFDGFPGYEVIGAEKEFRSSINGEWFTGVIDLILRDRQTGDLVLVDHKSSSESSFRKDKPSKYKQLLLYSKYLADNYGSFPSTLRFNLFRENKTDEKPFSSADYREALNWAESRIADMQSKDITDWMEVRPERFYCSQLCSGRDQCPYGKDSAHRREGCDGRRTILPESV